MVTAAVYRGFDSRLAPLCEAYREQFGVDYVSAMPSNLYGPGDNFDLNSSHVIPALMRKAHEAKAEGRSNMTIWGSGTPLREFLHVDDAADAMVHLLKTYSEAQHINVGSGVELTIRELAGLVAKVVGFEGGIVMDASKPDSTPRKLLDASRLLTTSSGVIVGIGDHFEPAGKRIFVAGHRGMVGAAVVRGA